VRSVSHSGPILILVHDHVQPPVQAVFDAPVLLNDLIEPLGRQHSAEQVVGRFSRGFVRRFAPSNYLGDGLQARPLVLFCNQSISVDTVAARVSMRP